MEHNEIERRNQILKDLMMRASHRSFWDTTISLTNDSLAAMESETWAGIDTAIVVGHGTSMATAFNAEIYFSHIAGMSARAMAAFELRAYPTDYIHRPANTLVVGVSCSGNTVSVVKSLEIARAMGCKTVLLAGEGELDGAKAAEYRVVTDCLIERRDESSHPYSVSHLFLLLGAYKLAIMIGKANGKLDEQGVAYWNGQLEKALDALSFLPQLDAEMSKLAQENHKAGAVNQLVLGSGPNHGTMIEGALKICEFSWQLGAGEELEDFAHGRFRELDEKTPLMIICPNGPCVEKTMDLLAGAAVAGSNTIVFTDVPTVAMEKLAKRIVRMPAIENEYLTPFVYVFAFWFYGFHIGADFGKLVGDTRYGLYATDINFPAHFDEMGNKREYER